MKYEVNVQLMELSCELRSGFPISNESSWLRYQADCDGEWGEISFDFENGTAEILRLADWDTMKTNRFANKAIAYLLNCENEKLPTETIFAFES